jgi:homoserine O-succinyltransferase/O-acetyltransferase
MTGRSPRLKIAIVNNMPDSALVATERQFTRLALAATDRHVEIEFYYMPSVLRGAEARQTLAERYKPISTLLNSRMDALIVTGNEPGPGHLSAELHWLELTRIIDWAKDNTRAALWSCLAAHAAVLHLDGIERRRMARKKSGVLSCKVASPFPPRLLETLSVCHSRWNEIRRDDLTRKGYEILSEAPGGNVDIFSKSFRSRFLFLQGHPEYSSDSLMREYRRDVGRYLNGVSDSYPEVPENYFDTDTTLRMENYRVKAEQSRDPRLFGAFPAVTLRFDLETRLAQSAAAVFTDWLHRAEALTPAALC